jgi:hypothetical protein
MITTTIAIDNIKRNSYNGDGNETQKKYETARDAKTKSDDL